MMVPFAKMHGLGNDYIVVDEREESLLADGARAAFARTHCRRGFDVGADGVLFAGSDASADVQMRIFNADGSEAESCGNGLRCLAYFHHGLARPGSSTLTIAQPMAPTVRARVQREGGPGRARVRLTFETSGVYESEEVLEVDGRRLRYHRVDTGNPHAVFFLDENSDELDGLDELDLTRLGPRLQDHDRFVETGGINAEFVESDGEDAYRMRVHERGVGETAACGTGCIAVARAGAETGRSGGWTRISQPGGSLRIHTEEHHLEGPAALSFTGYLRHAPDGGS